MKKLLSIIVLVFIFLISLSPKSYANDDVDDNKKKDDTSLRDISVTSGVGLVAVGGAGGIVILHNKKKEKDVPSKELIKEEK